MQRPLRLALTFAALIGLTTCNGTVELPAGPSGSSPPSQTPPTPPRPPATEGNITVTSIVPGSGATLVVRDCTRSGSGYRWFCADQLRSTFEVQFDQNIPDAVLTASFVGDAGGCGRASTARTPLTAGSQTTMIMGAIDFSTEESPLACQLPLETSRMILRLWRANSPATPLMTREFAYSYKFVTE
jgi:hypothetical protein